MNSPLPTGHDVPAGTVSREQELQDLLSRGFWGLRVMPPDLEAEFRQHARMNAAQLLRRSVYGLVFIYLLVVVPISLFSDTHNLGLWQFYAMLPIGVVLTGIWIATRLPALDRHVETTLGLSLFVCLCGTIYCAMLLGNQYFGQIAAYETIYILVIVFSVLRLPTRLPLIGSWLAFFVALGVAYSQGVSPLWLNMLLYFVVPMLICVVISGMLEHSDRRDYVQSLCLQYRHNELRLFEAVAAAANEAESVEGALQMALDSLCSYTGWPVGRACLVDPDSDGVLMAASAWYLSDAHRFGVVRRLSDQGHRESSSSLAFSAMDTGMPAWSDDLSTVDARHAQLAKAGNLRAGFAFPVKVGIEVKAVLECFSHRAIQRDPALMAAVEHIGTQLTRVFERQVRHQERLLHAALHDSLTGLPNRSYLLEYLRRALAMVQRRPSYTFAVLFLDVDHFKWVNDSLGHVTGDALLREVAQRLRESLRPEDVVARLGGDEFAVLLNDINCLDDALLAAQRIYQQLSRPVLLGNQEAVVTASIGIALSKPQYASPEEVLRDADTAMYHAKAQGHKGEHAIFAEQMQELAASHLRTATELRRAIEADQLELYYQPIVALDSGRLASLEALVRWRHPEQGLISPDQFIPLAEETGLIAPLTQWVLRTACRQLACWQQEKPDESLGVSVNMCARTFSDPAMPEQISELLRSSGVVPGSLRLEVTETQLMLNADSFSLNLEALSRLGVPVYIDDFGTGYSSLSYLTSFNVSVLKIDRSFVERISQGNAMP
jgi:diguanylate cyclase (GGDEF)-like protein